jgi:hypothetical protein
MAPKEIAHNIGEKHGSVRVCIRRLYQRALVTKEGPNYSIPQRSFEKELSQRLLINGQKESLPLLHDIHLCYRPENIKKFAKNPERVADLFHKISYELEDSHPDGQELQNPYIHDNQKVPSLPQLSLTYIDDIFNPFHPNGIYQSWEPKKKNSKKLSGGIQETFDFRTWKIIIMLYGTGTIKIIFSNSEHPFDAPAFNSALQALDGIFQSRTGILFSDIQSLFHIEMCHFNSDVIGTTQISGATRLNCTVQELDGWLMRTYEKILGDELYIRNEMCLIDGNYDEHNLNGFLALVQGGLQPTMVNAQIFQGSREREALSKSNIANSRNISQLQKMFEAYMDRQERINQQMMDMMASIIDGDKS